MVSYVSFASTGISGGGTATTADSTSQTWTPGTQQPYSQVEYTNHVSDFQEGLVLPNPLCRQVNACPDESKRTKQKNFAPYKQMTQTKVLILTIKNTDPQPIVQNSLAEYESWKLVSIDTKVSTGKTFKDYKDNPQVAVPLWIWYTVTIVLTKD